MISSSTWCAWRARWCCSWWRRIFCATALAAAAFGVNVGYYKMLAFALSAAYAGVAGALYGLATAFVSTDAFPFQLSIALLVGAVVGGIGTIGGAVIGGLLTEFLPIYAQQLLLPISKDLANAAPGAVQGILLLVVLGLARGGIAGVLSDIYRRLFEPGPSGARPETATESAVTPSPV